MLSPAGGIVHPGREPRSIRALQRLSAIIDRTMDVPAPLRPWAAGLLGARNQPHFEFSKVGETELRRLTVWEVKFRETVTPPLWSLPISGSFWIDPSTGRVVRSAIAVRGDAPISDGMTVDYRLDSATALSLPHTLKRRTHITDESPSCPTGRRERADLPSCSFRQIGAAAS